MEKMKENEILEITNFMLDDLREKGICRTPSYPEKDVDGILHLKSNLIIG